jgi:pyrroloquinoline quinone biosynthesis protein B
MEKNIVFAMVRKQTTWVELIPDEELELSSVSAGGSGIRCLPFAVSGRYPYYVDPVLASSLAAREALLGLRLQTATDGGGVVYMPGVPSIEESWVEHLENCDLLLFDGTFWTDEELIRVQGGGRTARQMGHIPISGPDGSMERLANLKRPRKIYIHVNNTNPILDEDSAEYHRVREAGWEVAQDGWEFEL